jgi:hypothetical protein
MGFVFTSTPTSVAKEDIFALIKNFDSAEGTVISKGRNIIKTFTVNEDQVDIKSFKIPNIINKVAYRYIRKSKARRSFEYANILLSKNIGTPEPLAWYEETLPFSLRRSYYASRHLEADLTFRQLILIPDYPDHENILRQFTHFCFELHEKGIEFLDHSPGNTLIKKEPGNKYSFYLVDLNRMHFRESMTFEQRMYNLRRLTPKKDMIEIMSNEYAKWYPRPEDVIFETLWRDTLVFRKKFERKKELKKKLKKLKP